MNREVCYYLGQIKIAEHIEGKMSYIGLLLSPISFPKTSWWLINRELKKVKVFFSVGAELYACFTNVMFQIALGRIRGILSSLGFLDSIPDE